MTALKLTQGRTPEPTPCHDHEAEVSLIGALMISENAIRAVLASGFKDHMIYEPGHAEIYRAIIATFRRTHSIDILLLRDQLGPEKLAQVGGIDYLIQAMEGVPTSINAPYYAQIIRKWWARREASRIALELNQTARDAELSDEELKSHLGEHAERLRALIVQSAPPSTNAAESLAAGYERTFLPTGFRHLDRTCGGLPRGGMTNLGAPTKVGKSTLALQWLLHCIVNLGEPAVLVGSEITAEDYLLILVRMATGLLNRKDAVQQGRLN